MSTPQWFAEFERDEARRQDRLDQIRADMRVSKAMRFALCAAARRPRKTLCPVLTGNGRINAAAETAMLDALYRRGLISYDGCIPIVNDAGMSVVDETYDSLTSVE